MRLLLLLATLFCALPKGVQAAEPFKPISSFGTQYPSACAPEEIKRLKASVLELAKENSDAAWKLTYALLCGVGKGAERLAQSHMPARIISTDSSMDVDDPDHPPKTYVARSVDLMRKGLAWDATAVSQKPDEMAIRFTSNEVCVGDFTLRRVAGNWLLVKIGSACD